MTNVNAINIDKAVCQVFSVPVQRLRERTKVTDIVKARQAAMYFYAKYTGMTLSKIGWELGRFGHCNVFHARKIINNLVEVDKMFASKIAAVELMLNTEKKSMNNNYYVVKESYSYRFCSSCGGQGTKKRTFQGHKFTDTCTVCKGTGKEKITQRTEVPLIKVLAELGLIR